MNADAIHEGYHVYKAGNEAFVSDTAGSSITHRLLVSTIALVCGRFLLLSLSAFSRPSLPAYLCVRFDKLLSLFRPCSQSVIVWDPHVRH